MAADLRIITDNLDLWTSALLTKSTAGRGSNGRVEAYGIKKLRELILELAILGKLVDQDSNEDSALEVLRQVKRAVRPIVTDAKQNVPVGWVSIQLACVIASNIGGGTPSKQNPSYWDGGISWASVKDIQADKYLTATIDSITAEGLKASSSNLIPPGRLLVVTRMGLGKLAINKIPVAINQDLRAIEPNEALYLDFAYLLFKALKLVGKGVTVKGITVEELHSMTIALPPLAEQHRIVAKVDELMALCDQLEQQQTNNIEAHQTLVETLLGTLTSVESQEEFTEAWTRIANHFDTLFTTEQSIDQLKQTIVQLAVMGKLVPQDPNDEPASVLMEKISRAKAKLVDEGVIRKQEPLPKIHNSENPFDTPGGWSFARLVDISKIITKGSSPKWQGVSYTDDPNDILFVTSENVGSYTLLLDSKKYVEKKFNDVEPRSILQKNDFLMNIVGASIGRTAIYDIEEIANINQAVCLIRVFFEFLDSKYLLYFFNSTLCVSYMFDKQVENARANLSMGNIAKFAIPLPPLAEQHRIVAKVDELMALCDALKSRLSEAQTTQIHLADAIVEQAVA